MPFTLSHPIAVAPLRWIMGRGVPLAALVIGAMVPDVAYFVALRPTGTLGHTAWGILVQGLPCGLVMYGAWVTLIQAPFRATFPAAIVARWPVREVSHVTWSLPSHTWRASVGVVCGAVTHVVWDSFTHATGHGVAMIPRLEAPYLGLELYRWLQYGGGLVGGAGVLLWLVVTLWRSERGDLPDGARAYGKPLVWMGFFTSSVCVACLAIRPVWGGSLHVMLVCGVIGACTGFAVGMALYGVVCTVSK